VDAVYFGFSTDLRISDWLTDRSWQTTTSTVGNLQKHTHTETDRQTDRQA